MRRLRDHRAIVATTIRYATGVDRRDWAVYRSCFCDEIEADLSSWNGVPAATMKADHWVAGVRAGLSGFDATHHLGANYQIAFDEEPDGATCVSSVQATHVLANEELPHRYVLGGTYTNRLVREGDEWRIRKLRLDVCWSRGDRRLMELAARRNA